MITGLSTFGVIIWLMISSGVILWLGSRIDIKIVSVTAGQHQIDQYIKRP
jgi:hypothetical protein